jgi:hypothetical protein
MPRRKVVAGMENGFEEEPVEARAEALSWNFPASPPDSAATTSTGAGPSIGVRPSIEAGPTDDSAANGSTDMHGTAATPTPPARPPRRRRNLIVTGSAILIVVIAAGVGVMSSRSHPASPRTGMAPAAFVVSSTQATLDQHTADVSISGNVGLGGSQFSVPGVTNRNIPLTGSGVVNFDTNQMSLTATAAGSETRILESGGNTYLGMSFDGKSMSQVTGGAEWVELPSADQSSPFSGISSFDPLTMLNALQQKGWTVQPLGTSTIGGTTVSGYAATLSQAQAAQQIEQEIRSGKIPGSIPSTDLPKIKNMAGDLPAITLDVYIDGAKLLRQLSVQLGGGHQGMSESFQMTFENYGTPVDIQTPPPGDVVTYDQLGKEFFGQTRSSNL